MRCPTSVEKDGLALIDPITITHSGTILVGHAQVEWARQQSLSELWASSHSVMGAGKWTSLPDIPYEGGLAAFVCKKGGNRATMRAQLRIPGERMRLTRRDLLERCAALGVLTFASSIPVSALAAAWDDAEKKRQPTPFCELGPFYKRQAPHTSILRAAGDAGMPLALSGVVYDTRGDVVPDAKLEIWQTDNAGQYDIEGYRYRAVLEPGAKANYTIESVMPGHYPARVCQHTHYLVTAPGHKPLITQLYFATDPVFEGDPDKNYTRDPLITSRELVRPVMIKSDSQQTIAVVNFDLVMETL